MINITSILLVFFCIFHSLTQTIVPLQIKSNSYFQSDFVQVNMALPVTTGGLYTVSTTIIYRTVKSATPTVFMAYGGLQYDANTLLLTAGSNYYVAINLYRGTPQNTTGFVSVIDNGSPALFRYMKFSYIAIDPAFPYFSKVIKTIITWSSATGVNYYNSPLTNAITISFLWGLQYQVNNAASIPSQQFTVRVVLTKMNTTQTMIALNCNTGTSNIWTTKIYLLQIDALNIPTKDYTFRPFLIQLSNTISTTYPLTNIYLGKTQILRALFGFSFIATQGSTDKSFQFSINLLFTGLLVQTVPAVSYLAVTVLVMNELTCPLTNPYKRLNSNTSLYECSSQCLINQYDYFNSTTYTYECAACPAFCQTCFNSTNCQICISYMDLGEDGLCHIKLTYANVSGTVTICTSLITNCYTCTNNSLSCTACLSGYVLSANNASCQSCATVIHPQCGQCTLTYCVTCLPGYVLQDSMLCVVPVIPLPPTPIPSCTHLNCSLCNSLNLDQCLTCVDPQIIPTNGICLFKCGDGKIMGTEECDDNNSLSLDGCSQKCIFQKDFACSNRIIDLSSAYLMTVCFYSKAITFEVKQILKVEDQNKIQIKISFSKVPVRQWTNIDPMSIIQISGRNAKAIKSVKIESTDPVVSQKSYSRLLQLSTNQLVYLKLIIQYLESLQKKELILSINPQLSGLSIFSTIPLFQKSFIVESQNNHLAHFYPAKTYTDAKLIYNFSLILSLLSFLMLFVGLFVGNLMIPLETITVVQVSYFLLLEIGQLNPMFLAFRALKYASGYNTPFSYNSPLEDPNNLKVFVGVGLYSSFADNCNLSLILIILFLSLGLILKILLKFVIKKESIVQKIKPLSQHLIGSISFALIISFLLLITSSVIINFKTGSTSVFGYILLTVSTLLVVGQIVFFIKFSSSLYFNKILTKISNNKVIYILSHIIFRVLVGVLNIFFIDFSYGPFVILFLTFIWFLIIMVKIKPYKQALTIRLVLTFIIFMAIEIIYGFQRLANQSVQSSDINLHFPYSILILLYMVFVLNLVFFIYSIKQIRCCKLQIQWEKIRDNKKIIKKHQLNEKIMDQNQSIKELKKENFNFQTQNMQQDNQNEFSDNDHNFQEEQLKECEKSSKNITQQDYQQKQKVKSHVNEFGKLITNQRTLLCVDTEENGNKYQDQQQKNILETNNNNNSKMKHIKSQKQDANIKQSYGRKLETQSPKNITQLKKQIKKQLKQNEIIYENKQSIMKKHISQNIDQKNKLSESRNTNQQRNKNFSNTKNQQNLYETLKIKHKKGKSNIYKNGNLQQTPKYKYTVGNNYCTFQQFDRI